MFGIDDIIGAGLKIIDKVIPDPAAKAAAQLELQKLAQDGKLAELQADMNEANNISDRWKADASTDSFLAKNIRPLTISTLSDGTNSTSSTNCIQGSAKAWVQFNPSAGSITLNASYNVSSVTYSGTGYYVVNFTNAFSDTKYFTTSFLSV